MLEYAIDTGILAQWEQLGCHTDQSRAKRASLSLVKLLEDPRIVIGWVALYAVGAMHKAETRCEYWPPTAHSE